MCLCYGFYHLGVFRLRAVATGGRGLSFAKRTLVGWMSLVVESRKVEIALAEGLCDWGGGIS
jgi:hypothetical protein